jgi:hypothetical protein
VFKWRDVSNYNTVSLNLSNSQIRITVTIAIYIILGLLIVALEFRRHCSGKPIDAMTVFNWSYFVLFVFVPINVICLGADVVRQTYAYETYGPGDVNTALSIFFSYALFYFGYWLKSSDRSKSAVRGGNYFPLRNSAYVAQIIFLIGVFLTAIYVIQIGGIMEVIYKASDVRSGELVIQSKYIGYRALSPFSSDAFVLFFAVIIGKKIRQINITTRDKVFLFCAFAFFVYFALSTGGRRTFIYPIILCYLVYSSVGGRVKKLLLVASFAVIFFIAGLGSMIGTINPVENVPELVNLARKNDANWMALLEITYDNASAGLADSYVHYLGAQKASLWQFGFLTDIVNLPQDFFPSQILGFKRTRHMYGEVTEYFLGQAYYDDDPYGDPLGLHGYLLVNFGYPGMFALFFLLGLFYKWMHIRLKPADPKDTVGWLVYWWAVLAFFVYFRDGALIFVIKEYLTWWLTIALLVHFRTKWPTRLPSRSAIESLGSIGANRVNQT